MIAALNTQITQAADRTCAHAFVTEVTAAWIAYHLDRRIMTEIQIVNRIEDAGFGCTTHADGQYRVTIARITGTAPSLRGALRDWIDTRNVKESGDA